MAELTEEQVEKAGNILFVGWKCVSSSFFRQATQAGRDKIRAAAPHLQIPWGEPTEDEVSDIEALIQSTGAPHWFNGDCLKEFVRRRNAALQPEPIDPRRERIRAVLVQLFAEVDPEQIARDFGSARELKRMLDEAETRMLAALDEVK